MKKFVGSPEGLICPWCANPNTPIKKCPHNPFDLMQQIDELMQQIDELKLELEASHRATALVEAIKDALTA